MHAIYKIPYNKKNGFNLCQQLQEQQLIQDDNLIKVSEYSLMLKKKNTCLNYKASVDFFN